MMTRWMLRGSFLLGVLFLMCGPVIAGQSARTGAAAKVLVFVDGTRMPVQSFEIKDRVVQFINQDGKLRSVPRSYVNIPATQGGAGRAPARPARPAPPSPAPPMPTQEPEVEAPPDVMPEPAESEPPPEPVQIGQPRPPSPDMPEPVVEPAPMPREADTPEPMAPAMPDPEPVVEPTPMASAPAPSTSSPPPSWSDVELSASLVAPSAQWEIKEMPASFDVAVTLTNPAIEARATLALIRQKLRSSKDFQGVLDEVDASISSAPGYRSLSDGIVDLPPYSAHEFRFMKDVGFVTTFNQLVVIYSRDLAYVLSMTCPESRMDESLADFQAIKRGLNIEKSSKDLSP